MIYSRGHVRALEAQISRLEQLLGEERAERKSLLDRLLEKKNIEPLQEKPQLTPPPAVELILPAGAGATPEAVDAYRTSWIDEEMGYWLNEKYPEAQAREIAERRFVEQHKPL